MAGKKYPYDEKEISEAEVRQGPWGPSKILKKPCTDKENWERAYQGDPVWMPDSFQGMFCPAVIPDNIARHFVIGANAPKDPNYAGKDMFGLDWVYVPSAGGSIVKPGNPYLADANEWYDKVVWPDINTWDWAGDAEANKAMLNNNNANFLWFLNGCWYERLISMMDFAEAAVALIDDDQKDAVKDFFQKCTDLYCDIVDKCCDYYGDGLAGFTVHDDWGAQKDCFFSPEVGEEMIVPYMKQLTDKIHSRGKYADLHSCGMLEKQVGNFVKAGWDSWTGMPMNDSQKIYAQYGDKIMLGVIPDKVPEGADDETKKKMAREFVDKFPKAMLSYYAGITDTVYKEEVYRYSRQKFAK
ncbi:MAG: methyltransferase [Eubacteriaceae bacterium]|nr:methyltransferase [Eubacteriaceae bacterium]